ncbi:MAG: hypothetical protein AB1578_23165 [Thermodesulfobacteriota bacterium]
MQLEAMYKKGRLEFVSPVRFVREQFPVRVEVPEDALAPGKGPHEAALAGEGAGAPKPAYELSPEARALAEAMTAELDEIRRAPIPPDEEFPPLSPKQLERMAAFALREDR